MNVSSGKVDSENLGPANVKLVISVVKASCASYDGE